jgi:hypothetical protein
MRSARMALQVTVAVVAAAGGVHAAERAALTPKIERVAVFKNGVGYFSSSVVLPAGADSVVLGQLPVPSLGSFWVGHGKGVALRGLFTRMEEVDELQPAPDLLRLLGANVGHKVTIRSGNDVIEGVLVSAGPTGERASAASPYVMGERGLGRATASSGGLAVIRTERGLVALNTASIDRLDLEGAGVTTSVPGRRRLPTMRLELEKPVPGERVAVSYLRLDLVTGFPNVAFADVASPIAMRQTLAEFLEALVHGARDTRGGRGVVLQQAILSNVASYQEDAAPLPALAATAGEAAEDLFLYPVEALSLRQGETVHLPLFSAEAPYQHLYTWEVPDFLDREQRYPREDRERTEEVWHSCRLRNPLEMPLTTAPAQFTKDGRFTGQDICHYTAPGGETTIRINRAMNLVAEQSEVELERRRDALRVHGSSYDLVRIQGQLRLRNRMDTKADVEVTKQLSGAVGQTAPHAKDTPTVKGLRQVNTHHTLTWRVEIAPSEERTLSYDYDVYVSG